MVNAYNKLNEFWPAGWERGGHTFGLHTVSLTSLNLTGKSVHFAPLPTSDIYFMKTWHLNAENYPKTIHFCQQIDEWNVLKQFFKVHLIIIQMYMICVVLLGIFPE